MAELHRRVFGLSNSPALAGLLAITLTLGASLSPAAVRAQDGGDEPEILQRRDIERMAGDLRSRNEETRRSAFESLRTLPASALPAVQERLRYTQRQRVPAEDGYDTLRLFRHAVGSRRADDVVDIAPGILTVLGERRGPIVGRVAERLLLLRALENMGTLDAQRTMGDVFALTPQMWRWERKRVVKRLGRTILPGLIVARAHRDVSVRRWARWGVDELDLSQPGRAVQGLEVSALTPLVSAYGEVRDMDAMPVVVSYIDHEDEGLRHAARESIARYGRNAIWKLREAYSLRLGTDADTQWGWRTTMERLFSGLDEQRLAPATEQLDAGLAALASGDLSAMEQAFGRALLLEPEHPRRAEMAPGYVRLAAEHPTESAQYLRRALLLAPESADASRWQAALLFAEAESHRAAGALDAERYREVLRLDPRHEGAAELLREHLDEEPPEVTSAGDVSAPPQMVEFDAYSYFFGALGIVFGLLIAFYGVRERSRLVTAFARLRARSADAVKPNESSAAPAESTATAAATRTPTRPAVGRRLARAGLRTMRWAHGALVTLVTLGARGARGFVGLARPLALALRERTSAETRARFAPLGRLADASTKAATWTSRRLVAGSDAFAAWLAGRTTRLEDQIAREAEPEDLSAVEHVAVEPRVGREELADLAEDSPATLVGAPTLDEPAEATALGEPAIGPETLAELSAVGALAAVEDDEVGPSTLADEPTPEPAMAGAWLLHAAQQRAVGRHDSSAGQLESPR